MKGTESPMDTLSQIKREIRDHNVPFSHKVSKSIELGVK